MRSTDPQVRHVFDQWHAKVLARDLDGLVALYTVDGIFESPAVFVLNHGSSGILHGREQLRAYFKVFFAKLDKNIGQWHRNGSYFSDGVALAWEYPRQTPKGDQVDIVEWMDLKDGLIAEHRVYWGWVGVRTLLASINRKC